MPVRIAPTRRRALQMKMSGHRRKAFVEWLHLKIGEVQRPHLLLRSVVLAIRVQHLSVPTRNLRTHKENVRRVLIPGRKTFQITTVPVENLLVQHSANRLSLERVLSSNESRRGRD